MRQNGEDKLDIVIGSMVVLIVGAVILCSAVIPVVSDQVIGLSDLANVEGQVLDITTYQTLIGVAILMAIIGLVIGIIKMYSSRSDR